MAQTVTSFRFMTLNPARTTKLMKQSEYMFSILAHSNVQLGMDIESPKAIPDLIQQIDKAVLALHLKSDGKNVFHTNAPVQVHKMPEDLTDLNQCLKWSIDNANPDGYETLATVSANSHKIVVNGSHAFFDGATTLQLFKTLTGENNHYPDLKIPLAFEEVFEDYLKTVPPVPAEFRLRLYTHLPADNLQDKKAMTESVYSEIPIKDLFCYQGGKVKGMTEAMSSAMMLACKAINDNGDDFGLKVTCDLRRWIKDPRLLGNLSSMVAVTAVRAGKPDTIADLFKCVRNSLLCELDTKMPFRYWQAYTIPDRNPFRGALPCLTSIGQFNLKKPFKDVAVTAAVDVPFDELLACAYTVNSDRGSSLRIQNIYGPTVMKGDTVAKYSKLSEYALRHLNPKMTVTEAIEMLRKQI